MTAQSRTASSLDLSEVVQRMVDSAIATTTGQLRLADPLETRDLLARGEPEAVAHFRSDVARQIATALLWMDPNVVAVYEDFDGSESLANPLRIIVRVDSNTPALQSLVAGLSAAIGQVRLDEDISQASLQVDPLIVDRKSARLLRDAGDQADQLPRLLASRDQVAAAEALD